MDRDVLYRMAKDAITDSFFPIKWDKDNVSRLERCIDKAMFLAEDARTLTLFEDRVVELFEEDWDESYGKVEDNGSK